MQCPCRIPNAHAKYPHVGTEKTMTDRVVTGFYTVFSARKSGNFLHILGNDTLNHGEKGKLDWGTKSCGDAAPKLQISVPCRG